METNTNLTFSPDLELLAVCDRNGKLKIWETSTNRLQQEYVPNLHLDAPCTVLQWITEEGGIPNNNETTPKKKRKKSINEIRLPKNLIAMGSSNGTIRLFDVGAGAISQRLENGHKFAITAMVWAPGGQLYSVSEDKLIVQWDLKTLSVKTSWKAGKEKITSLLLLPEEQVLISAGKTINCWNLETRKIITSFSSHASQISCLKCIKISDEITHVCSGAYNDDTVSIRTLSEGCNTSEIVCTLALIDEPVSISLFPSQDNHILALIVTKIGSALVFKYEAGTKYQKPLKPILTVMVAGDCPKQKSVLQIPILSAIMASRQKMLMAYGKLPNISLEKVKLDFSQEYQTLLRDDLYTTQDNKEETTVKLKRTLDDDAQYISHIDKPDRRHPKEDSELTLPEKLENLSVNIESGSMEKKSSKGDSMVQLLLQALHSKDKDLLGTVLNVKKETIIYNTVSKLPVQAIEPFLKELTSMLQGKTYAGNIACKWIKSILSIHAAQVLAHPNMKTTLAPILNLMDAKLALFPDVARLSGRISLITQQLARRDEKQKDVKDNCLYYNDEDTSEEDSDIMGTALENSESEDNWDETSMIDEENQSKMSEDEEARGNLDNRMTDDEISDSDHKISLDKLLTDDESDSDESTVRRGKK